MKTNSELHSGELVAEAAAWRLASLLLERPRGQWKRDVEALAGEIADATLASSAAAVGDASEEQYQKIFGPGGTVSPREVSYCGFEDPGKLMAVVQAFYNAFAFQPAREESIDHIAVEAGFVGYLFLKEAYARMEENADAAEITRGARKKFVEQHLKRCALGAMEHLPQAPDYVRKTLTWLVEKAPERGAEHAAQSEGKTPGAE